MNLTVIICIYNTDKRLLFECLSSVRRSTLAADYEILLIDDGSDADYADVAGYFGAIYRKTRNQGHLGARLYGISLARGDYVAFIDSDDTVSLNYHRPMLEAAERLDADIVMNGWAFQTERTRRVCVKDSAMATEICAEGDETLLLFTSQRGREHSYFVLWNKTYRRSLLLEMKARLESVGCADMRLTYSEDALMNFFLFQQARKVINLNSGFYFYRIHDGQSITVSGKERLREQIDSMCFTLGIMRENIGKNKYAAAIKRNIDEWARLMARSHFSNAKAVGAVELHGYIRKKYGVQKNEMPTARDGAAYSSCELLGDNFSEIDRTLTDIYFCGKEASASYERSSKSISRIIRDMPRRVSYARRADFYVPKRKIRLRDKLIHNPFVYKIGTLIFKKGSMTRAFLKKHF